MSDIHIDPRRLAHAGDIERLNARRMRSAARPAGWSYLVIGFALGVIVMLLMAALL